MQGIASPQPEVIDILMEATEVPRKFHVALSFAGEDRVYVEAVAKALQAEGIKVFYDKFEEVDLWGQDLYTRLSDVYQNRALFTVMFVSEAYRKKLWTNHERSSAQARALTLLHCSATYAAAQEVPNRSRDRVGGGRACRAKGPTLRWVPTTMKPGVALAYSAIGLRSRQACPHGPS